MAKITLTAERHSELLAAERKLREIIPEFDKLEECGEDCSALRQLTDSALGRVDAIKRNYTP